MIDIGYLTDPRYDISAICNLEEVEPTKVEQIDAQFIKFCPAVKTLYANTFEIKCPFDLEWTIKFEDDGRFNWQLPSDKTTINLEFLKASPGSDFTISAEPPLAGAGSKDVGLIVTHFFLSVLLTVANALPA